MVNFPGLNAPDLTELFGYPSDAARNGFQGAHIHGTAEFTIVLEDFFEFLNEGVDPNSSDFLSIDHKSNGVLV